MKQNGTKEEKIGLRASVIHMISGASARLSAAIMLAPIDLVKTRLQFRTIEGTSTKGIIDACKNVIQKEGIKGFARGLGPRLVYIVPSAAISFLCYERIISVLKNPELYGGYNSAIVPFVTVTFARLAGSLLRTPFDVVKQRLQIYGSISDKSPQSRMYRNTYQAIIHIWKTERWRGLFNSVQSSVLRDTPYAAIYFSSYEFFKWTQSKVVKSPAPFQFGSKKEKLGPINHMFAGSLAGIVATTATIPFDVIKTRLQTQAIFGEQKYKGVIHAAKTIWREEGYRGLSRGLSARILYITPAAGIIFSSYEQFKKIFDYLLPEME
eukprot:TRINITY_DN2545_c0_g1_i2.p1 TRINITY_DN2545_c0_g1~~TRINITY_DN2545_c0_g1_i2.p1  ORF type:complete len:323 (-),score=37.60 TRINITY_DN2545_c0_g1_i2:336-1304(-)